MTHRDWPSGSRVADANGFQATLLSATWDGWAWLKYDDLETPVTAAAEQLRLLETPEDHPDERPDEPPPWEDEIGDPTSALYPQPPGEAA